MKKNSTNHFTNYFTFALLLIFCSNSMIIGQRQPYSSSEFIRNATIQMDKDGISPTFIKFQDGLPTNSKYISK